MQDIHRVGLQEIAKHFEELEDPRSSINLKHPLVSVVVLALMGVLAGADGPTAIARWAKSKAEFLLQVLDLPNGIPRKDVFRRVLMTLKPGLFQACFDRDCAATFCHRWQRSVARFPTTPQPSCATIAPNSQSTPERRSASTSPRFCERHLCAECRSASRAPSKETRLWI